jgi:hypothetical protein
MSGSQSFCLISDMRTCHASNQKDVVFIIGSGSSQFKADIDAILETLRLLGFEGHFALLSEKAKGLDAFCDKICSKIREAPFCIALLNNPIVSKHVERTIDEHKPVRVPSANVYYEFGLAVALGKNVIPIVRKGFKLPFDVQHLDAIVYDTLDDLKDKLTKAVVASVRKKPKHIEVVNPELVKLIYGPLYNEIDHFLSRRDKFTTFNPNGYAAIVSQHKYLLDTIDKDLHKSINLFYSKVEKFNSCLSVAERRIREIVTEQVADSFNKSAENFQTINVRLETESGGGIIPNLEQILLRKTTPKLYLKSQKSNETVKNVFYSLRTSDYKDKMLDPVAFRLFFNKCRQKVEHNNKITLLRKTEMDLRVRAKDLKKKLGQFCR